MGTSDYSGLPENLVMLTKIFYPDDALIIANDAEATTTHQTIPPVLMKEITLRTSIFQSSKFRIKFKMKLTGGTMAHAQIYRNDIAIGTAQSTNSAVYVEFSENILTVMDWTPNDRIQIKGWVEGIFPDSMEIKDFRLCGIASEFENTKET